jgi:1-acyl-sn-glycerol-3-phosphate acyltransferase
VYVANHQSYLDIYSLFHLRRPFKARNLRCGACIHSVSHAYLPLAQFISKTSNFLIPIIGWSMYLTGHVPLKRMDRRSQMVSLSLSLCHPCTPLTHHCSCRNA